MNNFNPFVQSRSLEILINCYNRVSEHAIEKEGKLQAFIKWQGIPLQQWYTNFP